VKTFVKIAFVCIAVIVLIISFTVYKNYKSEQKAENIKIAEQNCKKWYDNIIEGFKTDKITVNVDQSNSTAEYRLVCNVSGSGYYYYSFKVLSDKTGEFFCLYHNSDDFKKGKTVFTRVKTLDLSETQYFLDIINENDFWNIPTINPKEKTGDEGTTIFIEGYDRVKTHLIKMRDSNEKYGIFRIYKAFKDFADAYTKSEAERKVEIYRDWYDEVIEGFKQAKIAESVNSTNSVAEYRVVFNIAGYEYKYYSLQVFLDKTSKFTYMVHESEDFKKGKMLVKEAKTLNAVETQSLLNVINENDFWNIPTIHPNEVDGVDGTTVFIEGYNKGKSHFIKMWEPDEKYGISKIFHAFDDYANKVF